MNTKVIKKIHVGSSIFFNKFDDFIPGDYDWVYIMDKPIFGKNKQLMKKSGNDYLFVCINDNILKNDISGYVTDYYQACTFLSPEFIEYIKSLGINITIEDLKQIRHFFDNVKDKHRYNKLICNYYIENNGFFLTDEQLNEVYDIYKKYRN